MRLLHKIPWPLVALGLICIGLYDLFVWSIGQ